MKFESSESDNEDSFKAGKNVIEEINTEETDLIYLFASTEHDLEETLKGANKASGDIPLVGCSSTVEISNGAETGSVVAGAFRDVVAGIGVGKGLDEHSYNAGKDAVKDALKDLDESVEPFELEKGGKKLRNTAINIFADPLHGNGVHILEAIEDFTGHGFSNAGQFAGDDLSFEEAYVFYNGEVIENGVVVSIIDTEGSVGGDKAHGFDKTPQNFEVEDADGAYVKNLGGEAPADKYSQLFGEEKAKDPGFLLMTPFGIDLNEEEPQIRVTVDVDEHGCFTCGAEVPETEVHLMRGEKDNLLNAAGKAAKEAREDSGLNKDEVNVALVFSCAGRHGIYDNMDLTRKEIENISSKFGENTEVFGLFGFGQIATSNGRPAFHEETASIQVLGEK